MYDLPSAAGGDMGLEGFSVARADGRAGSVAALNQAPEGLVLVVDDGVAYRAVPATAVARIETRSRTVRLTTEAEAALATTPAVEVRILQAESPALIRYVPHTLERLLVEGEPAPRARRSRLWIVGGTLSVVGLVGIFIGAPFTAEAGGGAARWLWILIPVALLVVGIALVWRALGEGADHPRTFGERWSDAMTFLLGISPRTRHRG